MTLKLATLEDLPRLHDLFYDFFLHSPYASLEYDKEKIGETFVQACKNRENFLLLVHVDDEGVSQGFLIGIKSSPLFSSDSIASELAWWIDPFARNFKAAASMLEAYEYWANLVGCKKVSLAHLDNDSNSTLTKWYKRRGYTKCETAFVKELN